MSMLTATFRCSMRNKAKQMRCAAFVFCNIMIVRHVASGPLAEVVTEWQYCRHSLFFVLICGSSALL